MVLILLQELGFICKRIIVGGCYKVNKEDVVVKMKTVSNRPKKYFQPVLTNNTKVISAKISESVDKERVVQVKVNLNKTDSNVFDKKIDLSDKKDKIEIAEEKLELSEEKEELKDNLDKKEETKDTLEIKEEVTKDKDEVSDNVIDSIREQLEKETDKIENKEKIDKDITTKMDLPIKIKEEIRSEQLQSEAENIKEFKTKLFLLASNAKKPVRIMVNKKVFLIGSDYSTMDCVIRNNRYLSRRHAKIYYESDCYFIEDAGSMNGTYINGVKLAEGLKYKLISGDIINLADCKFEVNIK